MQHYGNRIERNSGNVSNHMFRSILSNYLISKGGNIEAFRILGLVFVPWGCEASSLTMTDENMAKASENNRRTDEEKTWN